MKKATILSAIVGTLIEVYDFTIFPLLIPILSEVFFASHSKTAAINFALLAYVVSYFIRPFGSFIFGSLIDRFGQKKILILTTLLMTISTSAIGLLPVSILGSYCGIGLILCRIIQGLCIAGEFSSAIILAVERGKSNPAFTGSFSLLGSATGLLLANLSIFMLFYLLPHEEVIKYAWRIPFLIGSLGCLFLLFIRKKIEEEKKHEIASLSSLVQINKKELLEVFIVTSLGTSAFYTTFVLMPTLLSTIFNTYSHTESMLITSLSILTYIIFLPLWALVADRIGIKKQIKIASLLYLLFANAIFSSLPNLNSLSCLIILVFFAIIQAFLNSALPAFMVMQFRANQRGRALALSYNLGVTLFGALMPFLILSSGMNINPGLPITFCAAACLVVLHIKKPIKVYLQPHG